MTGTGVAKHKSKGLRSAEAITRVRMPITYIGMNDRWIKVITAIVLIFLLILFIWGVGIYFGVLPDTL